MSESDMIPTLDNKLSRLRTGETMEKILIRCIGKDEKIHVCEPHEIKTKCGIEIRKKNPTAKDVENKYYCYECTF